MSGAQLELAGQLRNIFPNVVSTSVSASLTLTNSTPNQFTPLTYTNRLPFDATPDKSGRVFMTINSVFLRIASDSYASTLTMSGFFYYQTPEGRIIYLTVIDSPFSANFSESNPSFKQSPETSFNGSRVNSLGNFGFENIGSSFASANITVTARFNVGFYGDYAEPDWETLFKMQQHEHSGLPALVQ